MPTIQPYPPCLCRPDAGGKVQSRSADTEAKYRIRFVGMARHLGRKYGCQEASIDQVVDDVATRAATLRPVSFRQYRAAILQALRDLWDEGAVTQERVEALEARLRDVYPSEEQVTGCPKSRKPPRTSAGRARYLSEASVACLVTALYAEGSDEARAAAGILEHGCDLGPRPIEWFEAEIVGHVLRCRSAKFSLANGRALAATRDIPLDDYDEGDIRLLTDHLATMQRVTEQAGTPELALRRMQSKLRKVRGHGQHHWICLYTSRQQYDRLILARELMNRVTAKTCSNSKLPELVELFLSRPLVTVPLGAKLLKVTPKAVDLMLAQLGGALPREPTGRTCYRAWVIV